MQQGERPPSVAQRHPRVGGPHSATLRRRLEMKHKLHGEEAVKITYELTNHRWAELTLVWTRGLWRWKGRTDSEKPRRAKWQGLRTE